VERLQCESDQCLEEREIMNISRQNKGMGSKKLQVIWVVLIILIWEGITRLGLVNPLLLPPLSEIMVTLFEELLSGDLVFQLYNSIKLIVLALVLGALLALFMGYMSYFYLSFRSLFDLLSAILHPLPGIALLPVIIIWAGVGEQAIFIVILHAVLWPIYINIKLGLEAVEVPLIEVAYNNGATNAQLFRYVLLPQSIEPIMAGIKIGWSRGWRGAISAEMVFGAIGSIGGIGWHLYETRAFMDTKGMYAGIILVTLVGLVVENLVFKRLKTLE
jgi:NitT/TauT family transport system permease protein